VFAAVADGIVDPPAANIYTTQLTASIESKAQIQWALDKVPRSSPSSPSTMPGAGARYEPMIQDFKRAGSAVVADEEVTVDQNDGTAQALQLKASGADAVMLARVSQGRGRRDPRFDQDRLQSRCGSDRLRSRICRPCKG
jgi:hypothetical protein